MQDKKANIPADILEALCSLGVKYNLNKIILFGSRARGDCFERSDIDIAIAGINDAMKWFDFKEDIEKIPTLLMFDVIDLNSDMIEPDIRESIKEEGIILYEKI